MLVTKNLSHNVVEGAGSLPSFITDKLNLSSQRVKRERVKMTKIIIDERGMVDIDTLSHHPLNELLYPISKHEQDIQLLADKLEEEYVMTKCPNHTPIVICKETGIIFSGNFRVRAAKRTGYKKLKAIYCTKVYDPKTNKHDELIFLEKYNVDGKRDEYNITTLLHRYYIKNKFFEEKNNREMTPAERNKFATENRFDKTKFKNYLTVSNEDPALLKKVVDGKITLTKALRKLGKVKDDKKYNPNRHNFFKTLDDNPSISENALKYAYQMIDEFRSIGNGIIFDKDMGWESNQITGPLSNIWMSAFVKGFNSVKVEDLRCNTPRNRQGYADMHFENLTNKFSDTFLSERIEVKVAMWGGTASATTVYGGMGSVRISPHEYILGFWNQELKKHFVVITTLDKNDWITDGRDANATMTLSYWFNKYYDHKDKYRILVGDIYKGNKSIEVTWGDLPQLDTK